ncbi:hypothetical protein HY994_06580 [Candidatus Micrarchaeota archaeon]|nr:hypothetical protein [Candidatus Micrarchaeota archaeon]
MKPHPAKTDIRAIASSRCKNLLDLAKTMWPKDQTLARRYVKLARQLAMRHRVHLDPRQYCKACGVPFVADTLKVRQDRANKSVLYACRNCSNLRRIPYHRKANVPRKAGLNRQPGSTKSRRTKKR